MPGPTQPTGGITIEIALNDQGTMDLTCMRCGAVITVPDRRRRDHMPGKTPFQELDVGNAVVAMIVHLAEHTITRG